MAIVLLDVDELQAVNTRRGLVAGDALLDELDQLLRPDVRPDDTIERREGGTYALILPETLHTRDRSENVAAYAVALGLALGLDEQHVMRRHAGATVVEVFTRLLDDGNLDVLALRVVPDAAVR